MASAGSLWFLCTLLLVPCAVPVNSSNSSSVKQKLYIGAFFDLETTNGLGTHPAAMMAVDEINNDPQHLRDYELVLVNKSTKGLLSHVTRQLYHFLHEGPTKLMLLGPFSNDLAKTVAAYAGLKNIGVLQFSYGATDVQLSSNRNLYPLFFRTVPTEHVFNEPRLEFIRHFKWKEQIALIYHHSPHYTEINYLLYKKLELNGIHIVSNEGFTEDPELPLKTLKENGAHIIIGTFHYSDVKKVLCKAYHNGMYGENYVWLLIATPTMTSEWWGPEPGDKLSCTRSQLQTALNYHFVFHYKNEINGTMISGKTTSDFDAAYQRRVPVSRFRSAHAPYAYEAVWAMAQVLERARPTLKQWGQPLHSLGYGKKDVTDLMLRETKKTFFIGPSGEVGFETNGNRRSEVFIGQFRPQGATHEVGRYSFHPATLTLGGSPNANSQVDDKLHGIQWPADKPYEQTVIGTKWAHINSILFIIISILAGLALMICLFCLLGMVVLRNHRVIENSGFVLTVLLIVGCAFCLMAALLLGLDGALISSDLLLKVCKIRTWLLSIGFTLCLGSFLSRVWYAYNVLERRPETIDKVPWLVLFAGVLVLLVIDVIFLAIWHGVFPPRVFEFVREVEHPRPFYTETVMIEQCISEDNAAALAILLLPKLLLLLIGTVAGWTTRMVYVPLCNNTRACSLCLGIMFLTCCVEVPVTLRLREYPNAFFGITGVVIVVLALILLVVSVLPQLKRAWQCRKRRQRKQEDNLEHHSLASATLEHTCAPLIADWQYMISGLTNKRETVAEPRVVVEKELVYVEPEKVATSVNETQTEAVTLLSKYVLTDPIEEPEPEKPEVADVTIQTDDEPVTPVSEVDTQTVAPEMSDSRIQTVEIETRNAQVQADEMEAPLMDFADDVSDAGSSVSTVSTASQSGKKRKSRFGHIKSKVDTNLTEERKLALPTKVVNPRLRIKSPRDQYPPEDV